VVNTPGTLSVQRTVYCVIRPIKCIRGEKVADRELWFLLGVPSHPKLPFNFLRALSRDQAKDVFNHVLDIVLECDHSSPLK
jgi:hypothetical protein